MNTEQTSENIYHIYLWHTKCSSLVEVYIERVFPNEGMGGSSSTSQKFTHSPLPHQIFIPSLAKVNSTQEKNKNVIFSCSHSSCTIFVLISYSFETQIMLILILIDVQYSQNAVFSFENFSNRQNYPPQVLATW